MIFQQILTAFVLSFFSLTIHAAFFNTAPLSFVLETGLVQLQQHDFSMQVTPTERDAFRQSGHDHQPAMSIGISYTPVFASPADAGRRWLPYLKLALNMRQLSQDISGNVFQYHASSLDNYHYTIEVQQLSLMLDSIVSLLQLYDRYNVYLIGGIGWHHSQAKYFDHALLDVQGGGLSIGKQTSQGVIYEWGGGVEYLWNSVISIFLEYRYAYTPLIKLGTHGTLNALSISIPVTHFALAAQSLALGMNWHFNC